MLAQQLEVLTAELADKDARLAHITAQLHHAREQLTAKQRCVKTALLQLVRVIPHINLPGLAT